MALQFVPLLFNLFGGVIARKIGERIARPVDNVTQKFQGSRTLTVASWTIVGGLVLAVLNALTGVDWAAYVGPVWGGLIVSVMGVVIAVLRLITNSPAR